MKSKMTKRIESLRGMFVVAVSAILSIGLAPGAEAVPVLDVPVDFPHPWEWQMEIQPVDTLGNPVGAPQQVVAAGQAVIRLDSGISGFDFGDLTNQATLPPGPPINIQTEIVSMSLTGNSPVFGGAFEVRLAQPSIGQILGLENQGGTLVGDSFLDVFVEFDLIDAGMLLTADPMQIGMLFTPANGPPAFDAAWMPFFNWRTFTVNTPLLVDQTGLPWDTVVTVHTTIPGMRWDVPEPATVFLGGIGLASLGGFLRRRRT